MVQSSFRPGAARNLALQLSGSNAPRSFAGRASAATGEASPMKLITTTALALIMAVSATPAAAQYGGGMGSSGPPPQMANNSREQAQEAPAQQQQKGPQPSKK